MASVGMLFGYSPPPVPVVIRCFAGQLSRLLQRGERTDQTKCNIIANSLFTVGSHATTLISICTFFHYVRFQSFGNAISQCCTLIFIFCALHLPQSLTIPVYAGKCYFFANEATGWALIPLTTGLIVDQLPLQFATH